jgi:SPP1 gp7 family putative phage head morphogenesis protein
MCQICNDIVNSPWAEAEYTKILRQNNSLSEFIKQLSKANSPLIEGGRGGLHLLTVQLTYHRLLDTFTNDGKSPLIEGGRGVSLKQNLFTFAAAKNANYIKTALVTLNSFQGLQQVAEEKALHKLYYRQFQEVEAEHVRQVAQAWQNWADIERFPNASKYLTYHTAGDDRVRPQHAAWSGINLLSSNPFWNTRYPPNGYNCRCWVTSDFERAAGHAELDSASLSKLPKPDPGFAVNWGKTNYAFPPEHPYFKNMSPTLKKEIERLWNNQPQ